MKSLNFNEFWQSLKNKISIIINTSIIRNQDDLLVENLLTVVAQSSRKIIPANICFIVLRRLQKATKTKPRSKKVGPKFDQSSHIQFLHKHFYTFLLLYPSQYCNLATCDNCQATQGCRDTVKVVWSGVVPVLKTESPRGDVKDGSSHSQ